MRRLSKGPIPQTLAEHAARWTEEFRRWISDGKPKNDSRATRYNQETIKEALFAESHGKCAYCEFEVEGGSWGEIEHILPKIKVPELVCDWNNLALSCSPCNNPKDDYYDPERPLLNPYIDVPEEHLRYDLEFAEGLSTRGDKTVSQMKMNRSTKRNTRNRRLDILQKEVLEFQEIENDQLRNYAAGKLRILWTDPKIPHSYMYECYLRRELPELFQD